MSNSTGKVELSLEEYIATLRHSSLPTLVVEGNDDLIIYRRLESSELSVLPVGGRENVLSLFARSAEITHVKVAFIADKDTWVYTEIPAEYQSNNLFFTTGYSIENDVIVDGGIIELMSISEKQKFDIDLNIFSCWYAINLNNHLSDSCMSFKSHPNTVFDDQAVCEEYTRKLHSRDYPTELFDQILSDYQLKIRGKSLFGLMMRHLSYKGRNPKHNSKSLMEVVSISPGDLLNKIKTDIHTFFAT